MYTRENKVKEEREGWTKGDQTCKWEKECTIKEEREGWSRYIFNEECLFLLYIGQDGVCTIGVVSIVFHLKMPITNYSNP